MILKVLKAIFGGIFKVLSYIFITLGLWLPAVYSIVYFVVVGTTEASFANHDVLVGYFIGLGISAALGLIIAMLMSKRRKRLKAGDSEEEQKPAKSGRRAKGTEENVTEQPVQPQYIPYPYPYPYPYPPAQDFAQPPHESQPHEPQPQPQNNFSVTSPQHEPQLQSYQPVNQTPPPQTLSSAPQSGAAADTFISYESPRGETLKADGRTKVDESEEERPMVFRTRRDPNVFVCEYSDRFQYWRRTRAGMILERTEYKGIEDLFGDRRR